MIRRMGNNRLSQVFPGYTGYAPLGLFQGSDLTPQYVEMPQQGQVTASLRSHRQPVYGESLRETPQAQRARMRDENTWIRRLLAMFGLS
jgi:hypothetical protein